MLDWHTLLADAAPLRIVSWHMIPMAAIISLVYSATRVELPEAILNRAARLFGTIIMFLGIVFAVLWVFSLGL